MLPVIQGLTAKLSLLRLQAKKVVLKETGKHWKKGKNDRKKRRKEFSNLVTGKLGDCAQAIAHKNPDRTK
jgi:hypothetical protein